MKVQIQKCYEILSLFWVNKRLAGNAYKVVWALSLNTLKLSIWT